MNLWGDIAHTISAKTMIAHMLPYRWMECVVET